MNGILEEKVSRAMLLIRHAYRHAKWQGKELEIAYSGGKDSDVILELARMSGIKYRAIYRNTTIDPSGTIKHCIENGVEILRPRKDFKDCILMSGFPTPNRRHCCAYLKEFAVLDYAVLGIRRSESVNRAKRYKEPEVCRSYNNGGGKAIQYLPLLEWTDDDVMEFIKERGIKCHPLYYDSNGEFHVERRLGCIGCPLQYYKKRQNEFRAHPKMVRFYCRYGKKYMESHPHVKVCSDFADVYEWFTCSLFYNNDINKFRVDFPCGSMNARAYLEQEFAIKLDF